MRKFLIAFVVLALGAVAFVPVRARFRISSSATRLSSAQAVQARTAAPHVSAPHRAAAVRAAAPTSTPTPKLAARPSGEPECGATIKKSVALEFNLLDCPSDGLIIGADRISIDLNGFIIDGTGDGVGIRNSKGYKNITITGGAVSDFDVGVLVEGKKVDTSNTISKLELSKNVTAVRINSVRSNTLLKNELTDNESGFEVNADSNLVTKNDIERSRPAIAFSGSNNEFSKNSITFGGNGISGRGDHNAITNNVLEDGMNNAVVVSGSRNAITDNDIKGFRGIGVWMRQNEDGNATSNHVSSNVVRSDGGDGFLVDSNSSRIEDNDSARNGGDGIVATGDDPVLVDNRAHDNGGRGIVAGEGARGEDNDANDNGKTDCAPSGLCD